MAYTFKHGDRPLDEYTIQRAVGRGGFGEVYYAVSDGGREVALKYLKENPHVELRGVSNCINLKSPHLVSIFDVKKSNDGEYFIVMEYCSGPSLRDLLIAEPKGFSPEKAVFFAREIAKGLAYLHERGIVHRDLKPGNIFFDDGYVKIGDYGLSKFISVSRHSAQTASVGTVHYMAPEIGSGSYSRGVDIYAMGVMLYEMLCGKVPFEGSTMAEVLMKHLTTRPELDELPHGFSRIIRKALEKDPKDRYQTVEEMVDDLLSGEEIQKSLAGFKPDSLSAAVRHGGDRTDSPMPSPNTPGGFVFQADIGRGGVKGGFGYAAEVMREARRENQAELPDKVAKKFDKISRKINKKIAKLGGRPISPPPAPAPDGSPIAHVAPAKRVLLLGVLLLGLSLAFGLIVGSSTPKELFPEERGGSAGMLATAMFIAVALGRKTTHWFGVQDGPTWAEKMVRAVTAAGPIALGCIPLFTIERGMGVWLGLIAAATFFDWDSLRDTVGEIQFGQIFSKALGALVLTAIVCGIGSFGSPERVMFISAGAAAIAAFVTQAGAAWVTRPQPRYDDHGRGGPDAQRGGSPARDMEATIDLRRTPPPPPPPVPMDSRTAAFPGVTELAQGAARWGLARALWGLIAFGLMSGTIVTFLFSLIADVHDPHEITTAVVLCTMFASFTLFALRKTGPMKRPGFWRETLRPFLISLSLFGIGGTTTGIAREWDCSGAYCGETEVEEAPEEPSVDEPTPDDLPLAIHAKTFAQEAKAQAMEMKSEFSRMIHVNRGWAGASSWTGNDHRCVNDEGRVALVSGLVMSSLSFLFLTFFTGGAPRGPRSFLQQANDALSSSPTYLRGDVVNHRGPMILWMGIVGFFTGIFPLGIAAWVMGHHDLQEMHAGRMDPSGIGMTRAGVVCGAIISLLALAACVLGMVLLLVALVG